MGLIDFEEQLILSEFDNRTIDPTIGETVTALLRIDLSQSSAITLLERSLLLRGYDVSTAVGSEFVTEPRALFQARNEARAALVFFNDHSRALAILDRSIASPAWENAPSGALDRLGFAQLYAEAGQPERATTLVAEADSEVGPAPTVDFGSQPSRVLTVAGIAMAERRYDDAIAEYRKIDTSALCRLCGVRALGRAYELVGRPDSALAVYGRYVGSRALYRWGPDGTDLSLTLLALGSLYESRGKTAQAIQAYARFVARLIELILPAFAGVPFAADILVT